MVNINLLKGKIVERGLSIPELARIMGIDKATFYRKINAGGTKITVGEAALIAKVLRLNSIELNAIFFDSKVS